MVRRRAGASGSRRHVADIPGGPGRGYGLGGEGDALGAVVEAGADGVALVVGLAEAAGDADAEGPTLADGDALGKAEALADGEGDGDGVGFADNSPPVPSSSPFSRITTKTPTAMMTNAFETSSRTWTAISEAVGAREAVVSVARRRAVPGVGTAGIGVATPAFDAATSLTAAS